jgi:hypothetical protein
MVRKIWIHSLLLLLGVVAGSVVGGLGYYCYSKHKHDVTYARLTPAEAEHLKVTREVLSKIFALNAFTIWWSPTKEGLPKKLTQQTAGLERLRASTVAPELRPMESVYLSFGYVRLARVEKEKGNSSLADQYVTKAMAQCVDAGWKDCSETALQSATESWVRSSVSDKAKVAGDYK